MKSFFLFIQLLLLNLNLFSQQNEHFSNLKNSFERNEYAEVLSISDLIFESQITFSNDTLLLIYEMTAVSNYSIGEKENSKKNFIDILKIDSSYTPNPSKISPKIIQFFTPIKNDYVQITNAVNNEEKNIESNQPILPERIFDGSLFANSITRSIVFPGWGHLHSGQTTKGLVFSISNALLLTGSIFYIARTNKLEDEYIFQSDKKLISEKYDKYNTSYKIRNTIFAAYALLWIYTQLDILFFSSSTFITPFSPSISATQVHGNLSEISLSLQFPL